MVELLSITAELHHGRVKFRQKGITDATLSTVFTRKPAKLAFTTDTITTEITCTSDGLQIITINSSQNLPYQSAGGFFCNLLNKNVLPYSLVSDIYVSSTDFREDWDNIREWFKYFELFGGSNVNGDNSDSIQTFLIVTKDFGCYLFFVRERRASIQSSIRKILLNVCQNNYLPAANLASRNISGINYLKDDAANLCPFNTEGEWKTELSACSVGLDFSKPFRGFTYQFDIKPNQSWSNHLSQCYLAPKAFPATIWVYTHFNGSLLLLANKLADIGKTSASYFKTVELDSLLPDVRMIHQLFSHLIRSVAYGHYEDWLASSVVFWGREGEHATKWLKMVSLTLQIVANVVTTVVSYPMSPVFLVGSSRSMCLVVAALSEICLCARSRASLTSINRVINKYFVSLGFAFRFEDKQQNFLFLLFLDCFYQLICQNPTAFGINANFVRVLAQAFLSNNFFEFSFSSPNYRIDACRRNNGQYRWFFPVDKMFSDVQLASFVNQYYNPPQTTNGTVNSNDSRVASISTPILYYPFNLAVSNPYNIYVRSQSDGNLCDEDHTGSNTTVCVNPVSNAASRMKNAFSFNPRNLFRQRSSQTLVVHKPLVLRKASINQPLPSPSAYFSKTMPTSTSNSSTSPFDDSTFRGSKKMENPSVIIPRHHVPCLRLWSDFILAHEYDFDSLPERQATS